MARDDHFGQLYNFRDLGGIATTAGRTIRRRRLFRSDSLHALVGAASDDRDSFAQLGIRTVLDLRRIEEVERDGRVPNWTRSRWHHLPFRHRDWSETPYERGADLVQYLTERYADMAAVGATDVAAAVRLISRADSAPIVVHCVVGKDRTGIVCAVTLALLGVPDEAIATEYALTSANLARKMEEWTSDGERPNGGPPLLPLDTPAEAMLGFLKTLRARHRSVEGYLSDAGLDPDAVQALRAHLLE